MNPTVLCYAVLAFVATTNALPVVTSDRIETIPTVLSTWKKDFVLAGQKIIIDVGYNHTSSDVSASVGVVTAINNISPVTLGVGVATNTKQLSDLELQIQAQVEQVTATLWGSPSKREVNYLINAYPIRVANIDGKGLSIGVGLEGENLKPKIVGAAVGYNNEIANVQVGLNPKLVPDSVNVALVGDTSDV